MKMIQILNRHTGQVADVPRDILVLALRANGELPMNHKEHAVRSKWVPNRVFVHTCHVFATLTKNVKAGTKPRSKKMWAPVHSSSGRRWPHLENLRFRRKDAMYETDYPPIQVTVTWQFTKPKRSLRRL